MTKDAFSYLLSPVPKTVMYGQRETIKRFRTGPNLAKDYDYVEKCPVGTAMLYSLLFTKTTVLLSDINNAKFVNEVYQEFVKEPYPARSTYQVAKLPLDALVEIEVIAIVEE
ncbi:hypothetical protein ACI65C_003026 [Semiaphis heraclei]